jgi:glyoxylase-like metal-dependent hydrolase (beta-lactamase superfamily II)
MATAHTLPTTVGESTWLAETPVPGLLASPSTPLSFAPGERVRSYVLERDDGAVVVYGGDLRGLEDGLDALGVSRHYLGHWHEAGFASGDVGAPLFVHAADEAETEQRLHVRASFSRRHTLDNDFEVIPIPGHTPGSTAYLWDSGRERVLFTGDSLYVDGTTGEWVGALLESSDRDSYLESLELLRGLEFDVLAPWVARAGSIPIVLTGPEDAQRRIGAVIRRIEAGRRR